MTCSDYVVIPKYQSDSFALTTDSRMLKFVNQACDSTYMGFFMKKIVANGEVVFGGSGESIDILGRKYKIPNRLIVKRAKGFVYETPDEPSSD